MTFPPPVPVQLLFRTHLRNSKAGLDHELCVVSPGLHRDPDTWGIVLVTEGSEEEEKQKANYWKSSVTA